ncbi:uncharacterized protein LOC112203317 [Rosa chinensis]|uniref:uncharacterized protein LOC112203317 n=1 Tax=Rosa chinensis TaxID=74649 RepID=UPI000D092853|nr:uncharacterized protein LOC112203317 [Rosa chinensis]
MACYSFEETLTEEALRWFLNFPSNSIDSFQELGDKFLRLFIFCGSGYCTTPDLFRLKQRPNEQLRDFVRRWNKETNRDKPVQHSNRNPRERPSYNNKRDKQYGKSPEKPKYNSSGSRYRDAPYGGTRYRKNPKYNAPRYEIYTTLTASYEEIWNNHKDIIPRPPRCKLGQDKTQDNGKYCTYHEEAGHPTNICWALKNAIEHLIQSGKLSQYRTPATGANAIEVYRQILTTHGGAPRGPETLHLPKRQCPRGQEVLGLSHGYHTPQVEWDSIAFNRNEDMIRKHHNDPFLITMVIDQYRCHRVLVDSGAAISVMFSSCYEGLNLDKKKLTQDHEPLISFAGEITQPLRSDTLGITLGGGNTIAFMTTHFIVVDCPSSYNVILGRDAIWGL